MKRVQRNLRISERGLNCLPVSSFVDETARVGEYRLGQDLIELTKMSGVSRKAPAVKMAV